MKTPRSFTLLALAALGGHISTWQALAQGSLTPPPGAPAATMKTLDQIEPRIPVNATTCPGDANSLHIISQPGSYYFTGNITGVAAKRGITVTANDVTIDLNGFTLTGVADAGHGIIGINTKSLTVRNGGIHGWPSFGIMGYNVVGGRYSNLDFRGNGTVTPNGPLGAGCGLGGASTLSDCTFRENLTAGVFTNPWGATILRCTAHNNGDCGFNASSGSTVRDCTAGGNGCGFSISSGARATGCTAWSNTGVGFYAGGQLTDCVAEDNSVGISASAGAHLVRCVARSNGTAGTGAGISAGDKCTLESCKADENEDEGIVCGNYCMVRDCTAVQNKSDGIRVAGKCVIRGCLSSLNGTAGTGAGIHSTANGNRVEGNETRDNLGHGIKCDAGPAGDFVLSNTAFGSPVNYLPSTGSTFAPIQSLATQTNPSANH